jgi:hypothetical protein
VLQHMHTMTIPHHDNCQNLTLFSWYYIDSPKTTDFLSDDSLIGLLISTKMYASAHITTIRNRPTNKFDGLPDFLHTKESANYRPTANQYVSLCARANFESAESVDRLVRSELWRGIVIRFFMTALSNSTPSLLVETLIVNLIGKVEKRHYTTFLFKNPLPSSLFENGRLTACRVKPTI